MTADSFLDEDTQTAPSAEGFLDAGKSAEGFLDAGKSADDFLSTSDEVAPEVVASEAKKASVGAVQALDVMSAPRQFDWSAINEELDKQRLYDSRSLQAQAKLAEDQGEGAQAFDLRRQSDLQRTNITPFTKAGTTVAAEDAAQLRALQEVENTRARGRTPSEFIGGLLPDTINAAVTPTIEAAGRHLGSATGGAVGAALGAVATAGTGGIAPFAFGLYGSLAGSYAGGQAQEAILQSAETPDETQARQQRDVQAAKEYPGANLAGGMLATSPFFGPSLAQFGRAAAGDRGAMLNIGLAGSIGAGMEIASAGIRGEFAKAKDIAEAFFSNAVMNEPTRLGRMLGLHPSTEQAAVEAAAKYEQPSIPITPPADLQSGLTTRGAGSTADVFAGVQKAPREAASLPPINNEAAAGRRTEFVNGRLEWVDPKAVEQTTTTTENAQQISETGTPDGGVRPPEVPSQNEPLPADESGQGVQPSGQGESLVENAPEAPREVDPRYNSETHFRVQIDSGTIDATEQLRDDFDSKRRTAMVFRFPDDQPHFLYRGISERELKALQENPDADILGGRYSVPAERQYGAQYAATPEEAMRAAFHDERQKGVLGDKKYLIAIDARGKLASHLDPRATTTPELAKDFSYLIPKERVSGNLGVSVKVPFKDVISVQEIVREGRAYSVKKEVAPSLVSEATSSGGQELRETERQGAGEASGSILPAAGRPANLSESGTSSAAVSQQGSPNVERVSGVATRPALPPRAVGEGASGEGGGIERTPTSPDVSEQKTTSIKNEVASQERAARGISPAEEPARRAFGDVWDAVKAEVADNPAAVDGLVSQLKEKPRALTDREDALLLHRQIDLQRSFDEAAAEVNRAAGAGDEPARAEAQQRLDGARKALQELYDIGKQAGTETGRGLAARKMIANQDFTLAAMETRLRAEQGGIPLTAEQQAKVKEQADTIAKTQAEMDRILAERDALKQQLEAAKQEDAATDPKVKSLADRIIARLDLTAANAAKSLRGKLFKLGSAPDPTIIIDVAKIAAAKTAKKAVEFAQWSAEMVKEFGEKVRPFLQAGWDQREQFIDAEVKSSVGGKTRKVRTDAERAEAAVKARLTALANRTAKLKERTAAGDFSPMRKPTLDLSKNPEWVKLKAENDSAKAAYEKARYEARKAQRSTQQKIRDTVADVWSASRPLLASTDISAPGRQGIFFALPDLFTHPLRLGRQLGKMFRSQFSERRFQENEAAIKSRDNADLYEESDLYLADIDHKPSAREEQFKSELAEKIPLVGRIVRGSSRGFTAFMNTVRADAMDAFVKWSGGKDKIDVETGKYLAAAINDLTGRGNVTSRQAQGALEWLAKYLFSPRLWVSRLNTAVLLPVWRDPLNRGISPRARAVVLTQYAKFIGAVLALKWLAGLNGGKMEEDPRDSDFGKLQYGTKRYDVMGGIGNMVTLLSRIVTRKTKDDSGKLLRAAWFGEKRPERELGQILFNHLRNKAAPIPGAIYDYIYGRHPDRSKVTAGSMLKQTTVPITVSDTVGFFQKDNPAAALRDTLINATGVTVQDYRK